MVSAVRARVHAILAYHLGLRPSGRRSITSSDIHSYASSVSLRSLGNGRCGSFGRTFLRGRSRTTLERSKVLLCSFVGILTRSLYACYFQECLFLTIGEGLSICCIMPTYSYVNARSVDSRGLAVSTRLLSSTRSLSSGEHRHH